MASIFEYFTNKDSWYEKKLTETVKNSDPKTITQAIDYGLLNMNINIIKKALLADTDVAMAHIKPNLNDYFKINFVPKEQNITFLNELLTILQSNSFGIVGAITLPDCNMVHDLILKKNMISPICEIISILDKIGYDFDNFYDGKGRNFIGFILHLDVRYSDKLYDKLDILTDINIVCDITYGNDIILTLVEVATAVIRNVNNEKYTDDILDYHYQLIKRYIDKVDNNYRNYNSRNALERCCTLRGQNYFNDNNLKTIMKLLIQKGYTLSTPNKEKKPILLKAKDNIIYKAFSMCLDCGYDFTTPAYQGTETTWLDVLFERHQDNKNKTKFIETELYRLLIDNGVKHDGKLYQELPLLNRLHEQYKVQHTDCDTCARVCNVFLDEYEHKMCITCIEKYKKCQQCPTAY